MQNSLTRWNQRLDCPHLANTLKPTCLDTLEHARLHTFEKTCQTHPQREAAFGRLHKGGGLQRPPLWNPLWMGLTGFFKRVETRMFQRVQTSWFQRVFRTF